MIGAPYEFNHSWKSEEFPLFSDKSVITDDSVLTVATAHAILTDGNYVTSYKSFAGEYPFLSYGQRFADWAKAASLAPYNSFGNGSAMRVSPVGFAFNDEPTVLREAERSASATHNHPEGIKGAQAVALAIFMARNGATKEDIKKEIESKFEYDLSRDFHDVRASYRFEVSCQKSVPESFIALLASDSYEDTVRKAVSLGGDADTQACIAGSIAQPLFGLPGEIVDQAKSRMDGLILSVTQQFCDKYGVAF
jgi:ADP-ribosylglycohydrolase